MQGPLSRFGDTAANTGTLALLDTFESTKDLPVGAKTVAASASAAGFRIFLMPSESPSMLCTSVIACHITDGVCCS